MDESTLCCLHCNEVFTTKSSLTEHFRELHAADVPRRKIARYLCDFCPKHFADSWTAKHHKKTVHLSVREHSCDTCKKAFLSKKDLRRHIKGVHEKQRIIYPGQKTKGKKQDKLLRQNHLVDAESEDGPEDGGEQEQVEDDGGEPDQTRLGEHGSNHTESSSRDHQYTEELLTVNNHDLINTPGSFSGQLNPSSDLHSKSDLEFISPELFSNLPQMFANYSNNLFSEEESSCTGARVSVNVSQTSTPISGLPVNISRLSFPVNTIERRRRKGSPLKMVSREALLNTSLLEPDDPERFFRNGSVDEIEAGSKVDFDQREDLDSTDGYENANSDEDDSSQDGFNDQVGPVFQLENLENLQLVLPEQGEPQIVIPETGIRLKISGKSRSRSNDADSQVLTIVPGTSGQTKECEELIGEGEENLYYISPYQAQALVLEGEGEKETNQELEQEHDQGEIVLNSDRSESINFQSENSGDEEIISKVSMVDSNGNQNNSVESAVSGVLVYKKMADKNKLVDFTHFEINNRVALLNESSSLEVDREDCLPEISIEEKIANLIDERSGRIDLSRAVSCDLCDRRFISEEYLNKHIKELHPASPRFMLELDQGLISEEMFEDLVEVAEPAMLPISEVLETKTTYKCDHCEEEFKLKGLLTKHKKNNHNVKLKFECKQCEKCFSSDQSLKLHTTSVHDGVSSVCRICLKPVIDITRHIRLQHKNTEERFACQLCHLRFRTLFSMQRHKMMVHLKLRPYTCDYCEKSFGSKRDMERHKKSQHFRIKNIERKEWTCPLCKIAFDKRNKYDRHKKSVHNNSSDLEILSFLSGELKSRVMEVVINSSSLDL